jgi:1,4-alpha-glucan branching enzyme
MIQAHPSPDRAVNTPTLITDYDLHLFNEGTHVSIYDKLGAHLLTEPEPGTHFAVWAPNASRVRLIGDFNGWNGNGWELEPIAASGIWRRFAPGVAAGARYKYEIFPRGTDVALQKADPYGFFFEVTPATASVVWNIDRYLWRDDDWMRGRAERNSWLDRPAAIYEVHLGSWQRVSHDGNRSLTYRELADRLIPYVRSLGYTHIELLPVMEHPFTGSWGYQVIGFYAPTSRFGPPEDFKYFVDQCHQHGIAVILDWVPGHFPSDAHGLGRFDGTALYEHADPRQGVHRDWGTLIFNYARHEVRSFLLANALFWLKEYHADGLRVDAVASMLYLDYSRGTGEWVPNAFGGRENLDAIDFMRQLNTLTHGEASGSITVAEESTSFPAVSRPTYIGGLGFTYKWNMGWMHDILKYISTDPVHRRWEHRHITFSLLYAFSENFLLPFSHDEVVHGKGAMIAKIPGDAWQKAATLRALYGYMFVHPGKKLMFMGSEFGQVREWNHDRSLDWHLLSDEGGLHAGIKRFVNDLNFTYQREGSLHEVDFDPSGFQWIDCNDSENSVVSLVRRGRDPHDFTVALVNFTPIARYAYRIGVPSGGRYEEILNSDSSWYGGGGVGNLGGGESDRMPSHGFDHSLSLTLPPLGFLLFKRKG